MVSKQQAAKLITVILSLVLIFQLLLVIGLPLGNAAFGGQHRTLPAEFRIASSVSTLLYLLIIFILRARAGLESPIKNQKLIRYGSWVAVGIFTLGFILNAISESRWENFIWAPVLLISIYLSWLIARK